MTTNESEAGLTNEEIRAQCDRIVSSGIFSRSQRQIAFLDHIVSAALNGQADQLKEFALAVDVFGKDQSFDPGIDSIVRVEASRLRSKLREYYDTVGAGDPLKIEIPKGHYVPVFRRLNAVSPENKNVPRSLSSIQKGAVIVIVLALVATLPIVVSRLVLGDRQSVPMSGITSSASIGIKRTAHSIAVLPFRNRSALPADAYFVDGIHDDILMRLSKLSSLEKVISRTSMEQYRNTTKSVREIGDELGVVAILEGGVQRSGDRVRINVQLINAVFDRHIWSKTYERDLTALNVFSIQREIASAIASELHTTVLPEERRELEAIPTENFEAYELYLQAQLIRRTLGLGSREQVPRLLEQAVSLDPDFSLAYVGLARAYSDRYFTLERDEKHRDLARDAIDKAFALSPGMPEVRIAMADYYYKGFLDYDRALEQLNFAIPLARNNAEAYGIRAFILRRRGDIEEAIPDLAHAIELDPGNFSPHFVLADTYSMLDDFPQAISLYDRAIELAPDNFGLKILKTYAQVGLDRDSTAMRELMKHPSFTVNSVPGPLRFGWEMAMLERDYEMAMSVIRSSDADVVNMRFAYYPLDLMRGLTEWYLGDRSKSVALFRSALTTLDGVLQEEPDDPRVHSAMGYAYAALGDRDQAIKSAGRAHELYPVMDDAVDGPFYTLNYAKTYAMLNLDDDVIEKLNELVSRPSNWYVNRNVIFREPAFQHLHDDPRFVQLTMAVRSTN